MFKFRTAVCVLFLSAGLPGAVIPIQGLFNTGVDNSSLQVADLDGVSDPHWLQNNATAFTYNINRAFGSTIYIDENSLIGPGSLASRWISVNGAGGPGAFTIPFTLSFNLGSGIPSTASITGRWATDNCGTAQLNGGAAFSTIAGCNTSSSFTQWSAFSVNAGFQAGINTLTFNLQNVGNGVGAIRVEFLSSEVTSDVPEPATFGLLGASLLALGALRRRCAAPMG
ncbi:MAG: PEP-CTERM sorting domain-containing protein [Bryobacteraceae bacterium]|nr:PEP-CTERM sorting domain-containing protein [Bryobacteraceae bacterium]